ncbi:hypothetical protein B296_00008293 [Ensete ventricosum]|uniref:Uncharacterized protein n=1 Tax=Ensete ventricosum TaxID=4639 RepID=A0A427AKF3_ENSVE|nr:hypothetical protein B296_00008293 [Ensete ventricosum]
MKTDPEITFNLRPKPGRDSLYGLESDTSSSPRKLRKTSSAFSRRIEVPIPHLEDDATATSRSISPGTPPIVSYRTSKRKVFLRLYGLNPSHLPSLGETREMVKGISIPKKMLQET